jgi:hypothetical protein
VKGAQNKIVLRRMPCLAYAQDDSVPIEEEHVGFCAAQVFSVLRVGQIHCGEDLLNFCADLPAVALFRFL